MRWILVAGAAQARLLQQADPAAPLELLQQLDHAAARRPASQLARDRAGWTQGPSHTGGASLDAGDDPHRHERQRFAHELAALLEQAAAQGRYEQLDLVAPPAFLGELRQAAGPATRRRLRAQHAADLGHVGWAELGPRLAGLLSPLDA